MSGGKERLGLLEPRAEELAQQLHALAAAGKPVSDAALASPLLTSLAISGKRIADALDRLATHFTPPPDQAVGGFSQAEHNFQDALKDRFHDLAHDLRTDQ